MAIDPIRPVKLGRRAAALWRDLVGPETPIDTKVLVAEACRLTDRLDKYDKILRADPMDPVRSEARLAASALHRILNGLSYETHGASAGAAEDPPETSKATTIADEIAARRAARQADAAG
ncbi:hypothetical protein [Mycobacterium avium]|uniref:hypothetical protein n=1 Tax=Mycobacterium avium TaxID=1764 RepID=UPI00045A539C|nr:hypothetical protein [Mycobacterium avium]KBR63565.1 hypothetical protein X425_02394 [Mycobacterium avium XTB13-223]